MRGENYKDFQVAEVRTNPDLSKSMFEKSPRKARNIVGLKKRRFSPIPSPISILVFFALKTHNILYAKSKQVYYNYKLCAIKLKKQIFNFGEGIVSLCHLNSNR